MGNGFLYHELDQHWKELLDNEQKIKPRLWYKIHFKIDYFGIIDRSQIEKVKSVCKEVK